MSETKKVAPRPKKKKELKEVWMACRARDGCTGNQAAVVFSKRTPGGGSVSRFKCLTCGGSWHVQV